MFMVHVPSKCQHIFWNTLTFLRHANKCLSWWVWQLFHCHFMWMMQATDKETSALRVPLFPPGVINQNVPRQNVPQFYLLSPKNKRQLLNLWKRFHIRQGIKLPPGIVPSEMKQPSKRFEILLNSGLRNPALVNLQCFKNHGWSLKSSNFQAWFLRSAPSYVGRYMYVQNSQYEI